MKNAKEKEDQKNALRTGIEKVTIKADKAEKVIKQNFADMTDEQLTEALSKINTDVIIEKSIKSANIWKPEFTHVDNERSKSKVRQLRTEQVNLCATLNKWRTAKNEANLAASVLLLYSFSKSKLVDIKNYMGGKRKEATAEIVNKAYKYMLENI